MSAEPLPPAAKPPPPTILRVSASNALVLTLFALAFTGLMALIHELTKERIDANALEQKRELIAQVLPPGSYDNDLLKDSIELPPTPDLGTTAPSRAYRARLAGAPVALVLEAVAPDGYSGRIDLLVAVDTNERIVAVRVTNHRETPGLGDYIDPKKDKDKTHPWIEQFSKKSFTDIPYEQWQVKKDGGQINAHAGATISARAVTNAVRLALRYAVANRERLFEQPPST